MTKFQYSCLSFIEELMNRLLFLLAPILRNLFINERNSKIKRILLSKVDSIGDFILFTSSLNDYRKLFNDAYIILLVKDNVINLAETCPYVNEVWYISEAKFRKNFVERMRWYMRMIRSNFNIAINAVYSPNFKYLDCLIGWTIAPRRIAYQCLETTWQRHIENPYFTEFVPDDKRLKFEIDRNFDLLNYLGHNRLINYRTELWVTKKDQLKEINLISKLRGKTYAILIPGAKGKKRRWKANNFIKVAQKLNHISNFHWIISGSASEINICEYITQQLKISSISAQNYAGKTTLRELSCLLKSAKFCLSNETSAVHMAAAVGTQAICVLGGGHYKRFYPYPDSSLTIEVTHKLPCFNCNWNCIFEDVECILKITVEDVLKAITDFLEK